jgi:hypothetical protein
LEIDDDIPVVKIAGVAKPTPERRNKTSIPLRIRRRIAEETNDRHWLG